MEQLVPTKATWRGTAGATDLPVAARSLGSLLGDDIEIETLGGVTLTFGEALRQSDTDALVVLHRGELVDERYFGACDPHSRHTMMSCNKSMIGTLAECLISEGILDDTDLVIDLVPELIGSAWTDATIRQVLDMVIGMAFHEDYLDPASDVWRFLRSSGMIRSQAGDAEAIADYLPRLATPPRNFVLRRPSRVTLQH